MLRYRRYRAYLVFVAIALFGTYYYFSAQDTWQPSRGSTERWTASQPDTPAPGGRGPGIDNSVEDKSLPDLGGERHGGATLPDASLQGDKATDSVSDLAPGREKVEKPLAAPKEAAPKEPVAASDDKKPISETTSDDTTSSHKSSAQGLTLGDPILDRIRQGDPDASPDDLQKVIPSTGDSQDTLPTVYWEKQKEYYPVSSTIQLPTGVPRSIARIQHKFLKETAAEKEDRLSKLAKIKAAAKLGWKGYRDNAWMHDELKPVSGTSKDPFCGWAATLVDSLDTLYIMGLDDEFEKAVAAVKNIDFSTSSRNNIPLFETTIRYLGGLVGAYDVSGGKHAVLLDKAVELAEMLMGAFDTPNRAPETFHMWWPYYASQPKTAPTKVVLAEVGSLSMEFTRLAQLTKEPKYYDAIDRIADALVEWQTRTVGGTQLPGLFPAHFDASGCAAGGEDDGIVQETTSKKSSPASGSTSKSSTVLEADTPSEKLSSASDSTSKSSVLEADTSRKKSSSALDSTSKSSVLEADAPRKKSSSALDSTSKSSTVLEADSLDLVDTKAKAAPPGSASAGKIMGWDDPIREGVLDKQANKEKLLSGKAAELGSKYTHDKLDAGTGAEQKRKRDDSGLTIMDSDGNIHKFQSGEEPADMTKARPRAAIPSCKAQGFQSVSGYVREVFTLSGMADSVYEYFPKQYLLLGGLEPKYRELYERAMDVATEKLLFRPQAPGNPDVLIAGDWQIMAFEDGPVKGKLSPSSGHLACFAGGMYAMGAKIFNRPEDLEIGAKITEGCVWAYAATKSGIMPESMELLPCASKTKCEYDEKAYFDALDPTYPGRLNSDKTQSSSAPEVSASSVSISDTGSTESTSGKATNPALNKADAKNPQSISDDLDNNPDQKNPQSITDDESAPQAQKNPQKIADDEHGLQKRQLEDDISSSAGSAAGSEKASTLKSSSSKLSPLASGGEDSAVADVADVADVTEHGEDDIIPGKPLDYANAPSHPTQDSAPDAGKPITYNGQSAASTDEDGTGLQNISHEEWVANRISAERLPAGWTQIESSKYILRPEAIESVFYMYRITGDVHWREVGWTMWNAIAAATGAPYGNSAIDDVTKASPVATDSLESFWFAETLKYFYLLFEDEEVLSLDEWVLNTEAHPFKRPVA